MKKGTGLLLLLVNLSISLAVHAGVTGKIRGRAADALTGELLAGVNVFIDKEWKNGEEVEFLPKLGAATDNEGKFIILNVPPGFYTLNAMMMGYTSSIQQQVQVSIDRTTFLDFKMREETLELGESVIVEARRDVIQVDVAATETYISDTDYKNTPFANRVENIVELQSGISGNLLEGEIQIREGETREVSFLVDGQSMVDKKFNRPVMSVQPGMVQEIKIMRNGFNAEYGEARSGIINVITKNPSEKITIGIDYQFTPAQRAHYGRSKYDPNYRWEWRLLGGPKAYEGDTLYIPDGLHESEYVWMGWNKYAELLNSDKDPNNDLTAEEAYDLWKWRHRPIDYGNKPGHNADLTVSGPLRFMPWKTNFLIGGKFEYRPFDFPQSTDHYDDKVASIKLESQISPGLKIVLNGTYSYMQTVTRGGGESEWSDENLISYAGHNFQDYYPFYQPLMNRRTILGGAHLVHTLSPKMFYEITLSYFKNKWGMARPDQAQAAAGRYFGGRLYLDPQSGWIPKELGADDLASGFRMRGGTLLWDNSWDTRSSISAALTSQFHPSHELKMGFNFNYNILVEDRVLWLKEDPESEVIKKYRVEPIEFAVFLQDKIEFQGMIANLGLRLDYFDPNTRRPDPHRALDYASDKELYDIYLQGKYPTFRPRPKYYLSPRLGISHPLSEYSKIYFNYGHFVQPPPSFDLYNVTLNGARPFVQQMSDPNLEFEKTVAYEIGLDFNLGKDYQIHAGAFYKINSDLANLMTYAHTDASLIMDWYSSIGYSEIRGIEVEIRKSFGRFITGWINYNYIKKSQSNLTIPTLSDNPILTDNPGIGFNGEVRGVPLSDIILVEPYAQGVLTLMAPDNWGPRLWNYPVLENSSLSFQLFYQAGARVQHPSQSFRELYPEIWFNELDRYWANIRIARNFQIDLINFEIYLDVSNVLHSSYRYPPTGRSGEDYFNDLWNSGRLDEVGTDQLSNPKILRTENDDVYWARDKKILLGLRVNL